MSTSFASPGRMGETFILPTPVQESHLPAFAECGLRLLIKRNEAGVSGCVEILAEVEQDYDTVCCAVGTGTTLAGLIAGIRHSI